MFIQTAFSFSGVIQCLFCLFSGLRLHGLRRFSVFLASSPCVASASSYRFCSAVPPRWRSVFSRLAPVAKFKLSVWLLVLTFRSSRPAFCGRLTSPVRHHEGSGDHRNFEPTIRGAKRH
nr:DUF1010 domain-containing protein [Escherichia coli]